MVRGFALRASRRLAMPHFLTPRRAGGAQLDLSMEVSFSGMSNQQLLLVRIK
jgi:hypothetical protein